MLVLEISLPTTKSPEFTCDGVSRCWGLKPVNPEPLAVNDMRVSCTTGFSCKMHSLRGAVMCNARNTLEWAAYG